MKFKPMALALLGAGLFVTAVFATAPQKADNREARADVIVIDSMKVFGNLERPGVPFPHDRHTDALAKEGQDCSTCHESREGILISKFRRTADTDRDSLLDLYHTDCIACHEQTAAADKKSGPVECGECHQRKPAYTDARQMINFDASLHERHIQAADNKCDSCHHGYNRAEKRIAYQKGEEEPCRTCHGAKLLDNAPPFSTVAHQQCITCHREKKTSGEIKNGMIAAAKCAGCHDSAQLSAIATLEKIPRLKRNQPDITFVKSVDQQAQEKMDFVVFDHKSHEGNVEACTTCHHDSLKSCESCHSLTGSKEGNWVTLAQAMHDGQSGHSCFGCHAQQTASQDCTGCHSLVGHKMYVSQGRSCRSCHSVSAARLDRDRAKGRQVSAAQYHAGRATETAVDTAELPEIVTIDVLSDEYQGVSFPHREIVASLLDRIRDNKLAAAFHQGKDVVCQSCHHNSPEVTDPPPKCISCHGPLEKARNGSTNIPEMKAAYHQQCFDCHKAMDIKNPVSTNCVGCHEEKTQTAMNSNSE